MPCISCARPFGPICERCRRRLRSAPDRVLGDVVVTAAWKHSGPARSLVHRLKYDGVIAAATVAAAEVQLPAGAAVLVPVPRVMVRVVAHGLDSADAFASVLGRSVGLPVIRCLSAPVWSPRRAGRSVRPAPPRFRLPGDRPSGAVVVDDVVTSGATIEAAAALVGARWAVAITLAPGPNPAGRVPAPIRWAAGTRARSMWT